MVIHRTDRYPVLFVLMVSPCPPTFATVTKVSLPLGPSSSVVFDRIRLFECQNREGSFLSFAFHSVENACRRDWEKSTLTRRNSCYSYFDRVAFVDGDNFLPYIPFSCFAQRRFRLQFSILCSQSIQSIGGSLWLS